MAIYFHSKCKDIYLHGASTDNAWPVENSCLFGTVARSQAEYPQSSHLHVGDWTEVVADQVNLSTLPLLMCQDLNVGILICELNSTQSA